MNLFPKGKDVMSKEKEVKKERPYGRCHLCRFWVAEFPEALRVDSIHMFGDCRKYPPDVKAGVSGITGGHMFDFKKVHMNDWCGEFKKK